MNVPLYILGSPMLSRALTGHTHYTLTQRTFDRERKRQSHLRCRRRGRRCRCRRRRRTRYLLTHIQHTTIAITIIQIDISAVPPRPETDTHPYTHINHIRLSYSFPISLYLSHPVSEHSFRFISLYITYSKLKTSLISGCAIRR